MTFRKVLFWLHLCTGVVAGTVVLIMAVTGVLLMYEKQITAWADRKYRVTPPSPSATRLAVETLLSKVRDYRSVLPSTLTLRSDSAEPAALGFGRESIVYLNPYTGAILGEGSKEIRSFFHVVTDWHRWLGAPGENRAIARAITGACNLGFLFLVISGFCIWWPKQWTRPQLRNATWFRRGLPGKARDFNWHNVIGFWSAVPLFIIVLSATVISYPWASNLVYRLVGEVPPPQGGLAGQSGSASQASSTGRLQRSQEAHSEGELPRRSEAAPRGMEGLRSQGQSLGREPGDRRDGPGRLGGPSTSGAIVGPPTDLNLYGFDRLWSRAEEQVAGWRSITLRLPGSANLPLSFTIDQGNGGQPQKRAQLTLSRTTGQVICWEPFSSLTPGRQLRSILRFAHTGEVAGMIGQTIAGMVSAGASVLVYTGFALAWRRFRAWQLGRRSKQTLESIAPAAEVVEVGVDRTR